MKISNFNALLKTPEPSHTGLGPDTAFDLDLSRQLSMRSQMLFQRLGGIEPQTQYIMSSPGLVHPRLMNDLNIFYEQDSARITLSHLGKFQSGFDLHTNDHDYSAIKTQLRDGMCRAQNLRIELENLLNETNLSREEQTLAIEMINILIQECSVMYDGLCMLEQTQKHPHAAWFENLAGTFNQLAIDPTSSRLEKKMLVKQALKHYTYNGIEQHDAQGRYSNQTDKEYQRNTSPLATGSTYKRFMCTNTHFKAIDFFKSHVTKDISKLCKALYMNISFVPTSESSLHYLKRDNIGMASFPKGMSKFKAHLALAKQIKNTKKGILVKKNGETFFAYYHSNLMLDKLLKKIGARTQEKTHLVNTTKQFLMSPSNPLIGSLVSLDTAYDVIADKIARKLEKNDLKSVTQILKEICPKGLGYDQAIQTAVSGYAPKRLKSSTVYDTKSHAPGVNTSKSYDQNIRRLQDQLRFSPILKSNTNSIIDQLEFCRKSIKRLNISNDDPGIYTEKLRDSISRFDQLLPKIFQANARGTLQAMALLVELDTCFRDFHSTARDLMEFKASQGKVFQTFNQALQSMIQDRVLNHDQTVSCNTFTAPFATSTFHAMIGLSSFSGQPCYLSNNAYYEQNSRLSLPLGQNMYQNHGHWSNANLVVIDPNPNELKAGYDIASDLDELLNINYWMNNEHRTIMLDLSSSDVMSDRIQSFIKNSRPMIDSGQLNLCLFRSDHKLTLQGMDSMNLSSCIRLNNGDAGPWERFNQEFDELRHNIHADPTDEQYAAVFIEDAEADSLRLNRLNGLREKALFIRETLNQQLQVQGLNTFLKVTEFKDRESIYVMLETKKPLDNLSSKVKEAFAVSAQRALTTLIGHCHHSRDHLSPVIPSLSSYGFNFLNFAPILSHNLRIVPGGLDDLGMLNNTLTRVVTNTADDIRADIQQFYSVRT